MIIIGVDFHPEFQQIASVDTESGEFEERRLQHREEAERFYRELESRGVAVRVGMEASGHAFLECARALINGQSGSNPRISVEKSVIDNFAPSVRLCRPF